MAGKRPLQGRRGLRRRIQRVEEGCEILLRQRDSLVLLKLMKKVTKEKPKMWGSSMIGFGKKVYKSPASGREVEWFKIGFSPRKANFSLNLVIDIKKYNDVQKEIGAITSEIDNKTSMWDNLTKDI